MAYHKKPNDDIEAVIRYLKKIKKLIMGEPNVYSNGKVYTRSGASWRTDEEE